MEQRWTLILYQLEKCNSHPDIDRDRILDCLNTSIHRHYTENADGLIYKSNGIIAGFAVCISVGAQIRNVAEQKYNSV